MNYNYLRPHRSLKDKTPAGVAKIVFPYRSWLDVIKSQMPEPPPKPDKPGTLEEMRHPFKPDRKRPKPKTKRQQPTRQRIQPTVSTVGLARS